MKWYKMDCDAQDNLDMRKLVDEWGWDWYGRYWAILGKIGMLVTEKRQTFALQTNDGCPFPVKLLANDLSTTAERLTDFCNFLSDNHLIDKTAWKKKGLIYCPKLRDRADEYTEKLRRKSRQNPAQEVEVEEEKEKRANKARPPSIEAVSAYFKERNATDESEAWWDRMEAVGWKVGRNPVADWKASVRTWIANSKKWDTPRRKNENKPKPGLSPLMMSERDMEARRRESHA